MPLLLVIALYAAGLVAAAQFAKFGLALEVFGAAYPGAGPVLGWLVSLISGVGVVLGMAAGALAARIGLRRLLLAGLALGAACSALQAPIPPLPVMLGLRVVEGLSHLAIVVAAPTLMGTLVPARWRGAAMTLWGTFFGVGFALTAWVGVPLAEMRGPGALLVAHALVAILATFAVATVLPRRRLVPEGPRPTLAWIMGRHRAAYSSPSVAAPAAGWVFYTLTFTALIVVLPPLLPSDQGPWVAGAMPLISILSSLTLGVALLRHLPAVGVVCLGLAAAAGIAGTMTLAITPAGCLALFAALGLIQGASFAAVPQLNPGAEAQSLANGGLAQAGNIGNLLGTPAAFAAVALAGPWAAPALAALAYLAALGAHAALARRRAHVQ
ncbi:putative MFS family arabinose efflux permease [Hasllibacter halocynthiae]|uniref:Putative MFS family arabinose efflux permease n=1 Tax=Hasllibacter halocynthiae TaxID=595589 RepID=A0A2T0X8H1_9RHOB|nr:MFS transporter [Hasllibacter halocynthiae]PRY95241.1 putative MFS family arabinose efflux permease [Hasllibacter halocynthiae]